MGLHFGPEVSRRSPRPALNLLHVPPIPLPDREDGNDASSIRVLLVEDDAGDARLVREMLADARTAPFNLVHVPRLSEALQRLGEHPFDAVLLDLNLPDACGLETVSSVSGVAPDLPIVVLSGLQDETLALAAVQRGAQDYLVKGQGDGNLLVRSIRYAIERKTSEQYITYLAFHDGLTNLPNRSLMLDRLEQAIARCRRNQRLLALLFLDLDRFKQINDTLGHACGDELLKAVASRLRACTRESDTVARMGGDEFALILPDLSHIDDAAAFAEKILAALENPFTVANRELFVTASVGISVFPNDGQSPEVLLKSSDAAMYRSKQLGGERFSFYNRSTDSIVSDRLVLGVDLRRAIDNNELLLHYQPLIDLRSGRITGFESLARWQHPLIGLIPPRVFIPLAEERGLIPRIGLWVLRSAILEARRWQDDLNSPLSVSVNLSGQQFNRSGLLAEVSQILESAGFRPEQLEVELTESGIMRNPESAIATLRSLKSLGVRISVDDFGTGYSSLSRLKWFPINGLKIDQSFVRDLTNPVDASIVRAIITMAHGLGLEVTAEGVETESQLRFLRDEGCDRAQGFYFSPPLALPELAEMLGRGQSWN